MKDFQQRVVEEKAQLDDKITRLGAFFGALFSPPWRRMINTCCASSTSTCRNIPRC